METLTRFTTVLIACLIFAGAAVGDECAIPCQAASNTCGANCPTCSCKKFADIEIRNLCAPTTCGNKNWLDVDYRLFFMDGFDVPNLLTSSPAGTPRSDVANVFDDIFGNSVIGEDSVSGLNVGFGHWLDDCGRRAITADFFAFNDGRSSSVFPSDPTGIVSRPFFNSDPSVNALDAELVNFPGVVDGTIAFNTETSVYSGSAGLLQKVCCCVDQCTCRSRRTDMFLGYRVFSFDETLEIEENLSPTGGFIAAGTTIDVLDRFETENIFHGVELGLDTKWQRRRWTFGLGGRVALGNVRQTVRINGTTTTSVPGGGAPFVQPYGILASSSNSGVYQRDEFAVFTTANIELGYQVSRCMRLKLGYSFMHLNNVVRPGDQIDFNVNGTQFDPFVPDAGPDEPAFAFKDNDMILHGLSAGFEFTF